MIMFPMFVKAVAILSSASFVFSKMSLLASLILGLKFFLSHNHNQGESKVEIVHVPLKKYGGGDWDREAAESKYHVNTIPDTVYEHDFRPTQYVLWLRFRNQTDEEWIKENLNLKIYESQMYLLIILDGMYSI